jgi:hypothetical protein
MKKCRICNIEKIGDEFRPKRRVCKECERAHGRKYRKENSHKSKQWAKNNKERMKELQSNWYKSNKKQINIKFKQRYHDTSSSFKKIKNYRTAITHMLGGKQKTNKYIGCHVNRLKDWCKYCFEKGMSLDMYAKTWVVDHVIPLNLSEKYDFESLAKWYNIMPVKSVYNLQKNKYIDSQQLQLHLKNIKKYLQVRKLKIDQEYMKLLAKLLEDRETPKALATI